MGLVFDSSSSLYSMNKRFQGIDGFGCSNKQDIALFSAKTNVGCPVLGNGEMCYLLAMLIEYCHYYCRQMLYYVRQI